MRFKRGGAFIIEALRYSRTLNNWKYISNCMIFPRGKVPFKENSNVIVQNVKLLNSNISVHEGSEKLEKR